MTKWLKVEVAKPVNLPLARNGFGGIFKDYFHQPYHTEKEKQDLIEALSTDDNVIKITTA